MSTLTRTIKLAVSCFLSASLLLLSFVTPTLAAQQQDEQSSIVITELQTGGVFANSTEDPKAEFVELYNASDKAVVLSDWQVEFLTKTHDGTAAPTRVLATLTGIAEPESFIVISYDQFIPNAQFYFSGGPTSGYLAKGDGTVRIRDAQGTTVDMLGWGNPINYKGEPTAIAGLGFSLQRCFIGKAPTNSSNNRNDFTAYAPTPHTSVACPQQDPVDPPVPNPENPPDNAHDTSQCHLLQITEVLPNPAGTDSGHEFIEVHNPTSQTVSLNDCSLQTSASTKVFTFDANNTLQPSQYQAVYDTVTGLTMTNSGGGTVWLLSPTQEIQTITYGPNLTDDTAWALFDHDWQITYTPTPNAANQFTPHKPCSGGQERSVDTNRCVNVTPAAAQLTPCKEGQERNLATNRCRTVASAIVEPKPCEPHQIRNPQTNRCKSTETTSELKPCAEGQERSPDTNRCRKKTSSADAPPIYDMPSTLASDYTGLWVAGAGVAGALSYGAYEWRSEITSFIRKIKNALSGNGEK